MERAEELVGRSLGRYRITALVGKGGMATVYKATHPGLGQTVAIKVLHPHMATDPDMLGRFHNEAQAVANLRHPNIVRVLDFDVQGDQYFMVMEFVDGPTLATQLSGFASQGRNMPAGEVARILEPLCSAVDYAHGQGMIHRDIKPSNVLLTPQGEPVLTDYGIAKMVGVTQHTATGTVMGSAYYMSPEQAQGSGIDGRTDIYSLGVMLFEMLAGRVPYEGDTLATVLVKHITAPVPPVCTYNSQLPPLLDNVMDVALAKDPAQRFQTGAALAVALRQGLAAPAAAAGTTTFERGAAAGGATTVEPARGAAGQTAAEALAARTATRDVYISYAPQDKAAAEAVCARLEAEEVTCWIAPRDVLPGRTFAQSLSSAIHAARVFVLVFSAATNESQQVERELHMADVSRLPVVPLRVQDVQPHESIEYYLAGRAWVEASGPPLDAHLGRLVENVSLLLLQAPPRQPGSAAVVTTFEPAPSARAVTGAEPPPAAEEPALPPAQSAAAPAPAATVAQPAPPAVAPAVPVTVSSAAAVEPTPPAAESAPAAEPELSPAAETTGEPAAVEPAPPAVEPAPPLIVPPAAEAAVYAETTVEPGPASAAPAGAAVGAAVGVAAAAGAVTEEAGAPAVEVAVTVAAVKPAPPAAEDLAGPAAEAAASAVTEPAAKAHEQELAPASPAPTTVEPPSTGAAATTVEPRPPAGAAATTVEPPSTGAAATTVEPRPPAGAAATTLEPPPGAAAATAYEAPAAAGAPAAVVQPAPGVPSQPGAGPEAPGLPTRFQTRAVAAAAAVGVAWVVILFVLEKYVL